MSEERVDRRAERAAIVSFAVATVGGLVAAFGYWSERTEVWLGVGLALCLGGIGYGLVSWAKYLDLDEHVTQQREPLRTTIAEQEDFDQEIAETKTTIGRRPLIAALLAGSLGSLVIGFVGPIGSLGPKPRGERGRTSWVAGRRLVTSDGNPIGVDSAGLDQLATVFPDGAIGQDDSQVVLLRMAPELFTEDTIAGGTVEGWVAYSKVCTHAGCSVGLFGVDSRAPDVLRQLVCPCHQSVFDPVDAAKPVGGPATRSLPQLPIGVDDDGYLIALADFDQPIGPVAWNEA